MRPPRLPPLGALRAFHAVARHRSFKQAAEALGVSATAVSHQIKLLESVLECRVCERSAQGVSLTADGEILYAATQRAFSALEQAVVQIAHARQPPSLTVTTTSNFLTHWLVPRLADFTARFPAIDLRLHTSVERVDLHLGTVDAAIRYRETPEPDLYCTLLYEDRFIVVASPTLGLSRPEDLQRVTLFHVANRRVPADSPSWENWRRRYGPPTLNIDAGLTFSDETHALQAAVAGQGVVIASELLARDLLQRGVLSAPFSNALPGRPLLPGHYRSGSAAGGYYRSAGVAAQPDGVGRRRPSDCGIAGLPAADVGLFIGLVAANDIDQILHRISRGEWVAQCRQRGKGFINRDAVIIIGDRQQKLPLFPVVRQLAQQVINGLHRLLWNIQHHWFEKYFFLLLVKSAIL